MPRFRVRRPCLAELLGRGPRARRRRRHRGASVGFGRYGASAAFNEGEIGEVTVAQQASGRAPAAIEATSRLIR